MKLQNLFSITLATISLQAYAALPGQVDPRVSQAKQESDAAVSQLPLIIQLSKLPLALQEPVRNAMNKVIKDKQVADQNPSLVGYQKVSDDITAAKIAFVSAQKDPALSLARQASDAAVSQLSLTIQNSKLPSWSEERVKNAMNLVLKDKQAADQNPSLVGYQKVSDDITAAKTAYQLAQKSGEELNQARQASDAAVAQLLWSTQINTLPLSRQEPVRNAMNLVIKDKQVADQNPSLVGYQKVSDDITAARTAFQSAQKDPAISLARQASDAAVSQLSLTIQISKLPSWFQEPVKGAMNLVFKDKQAADQNPSLVGYQKVSDDITAAKTAYQSALTSK
ncbi:MAG: hypothetical protein ABIQ95_03610 [Bdellovibrionia bacterium]